MCLCVCLKHVLKTRREIPASNKATMNQSLLQNDQLQGNESEEEDEDTFTPITAAMPPSPRIRTEEVVTPTTPRAPAAPARSGMFCQF